MGFEFDFLYALQNLHTAPLDAVMLFCTRINNGCALWIVLSAALTIHPKYRKLGLCLAGALVVETIVCNLAIKPLVARPRPCDLDPTVAMLIGRPQGASFPSIHTASSFACVAALLCCRHIPLSRTLGIAGLVLSIFIAFSRMYLFVHFPSDVLCGIVIGTACGVLSWRIAVEAERRLAGTTTLQAQP